MPRVSVIMAAYNAAGMIRNAFESLRRQTYSDWECIICDDASTDDTWAIIQDLAKNHGNCRVLKNEKNLGPASSRNRCIEIAQGEYLAIQDADDLSSPERLKKQVEYLDRYSETTVVGSYAALLKSDGTWWGVMKPPLLPKKEDWIKGPQIIHASVLMRKADFFTLGGYTDGMRFAEDYDLWTRCVAKGSRIATIPEILYAIHWDTEDYVRKGLRQRWSEVAVTTKALRLLVNPGWRFLFILKPIVAGLMPRGLLYVLHKRRFGKVEVMEGEADSWNTQKT